MTSFAFASFMYVLGLFSCAVLVWFLIYVTDKIPITPSDLKKVEQMFTDEWRKDMLRQEAKRCMALYCGART